MHIRRPRRQCAVLLLLLFCSGVITPLNGTYYQRPQGVLQVMYKGSKVNRCTYKDVALQGLERRERYSCALRLAPDTR